MVLSVLFFRNVGVVGHVKVKGGEGGGDEEKGV